MNAVLRATGIEKRFGAVVAASEINISIATGQRVSLIGSNGAGKTTFVNMITGYMKPDSGQIWLENERTTSSTVEATNTASTLCQPARMATKTNSPEVVQ